MLEALAAGVVAAAAYFALQGELPYHDAARFTDQVASDAWEWDIAHILLQPTAVVLRRLTGAHPEWVLKALSSTATAVAVGLFYLLLRRLGRPVWQAVLGTILVGGCCSVLTLAPSAHPKLVAFPFVNGALLCLCTWERRGGRGDGLLVLGGLLLAVGGAFLASVLATPPFAALAAMVVARRGGAGWVTAFYRGALVAGTCGIAFLAITCLCYVGLTGNPLSVAGLTGSVAGKAGLRPTPPPLLVNMARVVFGTVNDLVALQELGATIQAWLRGQIPTLRPYAGLLPLFLLWLLTAALIGAIYLRTAVALVRGRTLLVPVAFLCGAQAWTIYYGLNDPEHWFQLVAPTVILFVTLMPEGVVRFGLPAWTAVATAVNLALLAVPTATYPVARHEAEMARLLGQDGTLVMFAAYPGRAYAGFFDLPTDRLIRLDLTLGAPGTDADAALADVDREIATKLRTGRVLVADVLDPYDWEAPWLKLLSRGVTKAQVRGALLASRQAVRLEDVGGIKVWELRASP